jgi:hypothetical protein
VPPTRWDVGPAEAGERYNLAVSDRTDVVASSRLFYGDETATQKRARPRNGKLRELGRGALNSELEGLWGDRAGLAVLA